MTKELEEKVRKVAEYDGWSSPVHLQHLFDKPLRPQTQISDLKYCTSFEWIMPVAKNVVMEIDALPRDWITKKWQKGKFPYRPAETIEKAILTFEPSVIFESVYSGILLLNEYKENP